MKITYRQTHAFIELKVDRLEDTIFKSDPKEIEDAIKNLLEVADQLADMIHKTPGDFLNIR